MLIVDQSEKKAIGVSFPADASFKAQPGNRAEVLIVDDEPLIREMIHRKLTDRGLACADADSGDEALKMLAEGDFALVLLDIRMPQKDGLEVLEEIRTKYPDVAVIMVTVIADIDIAIDCMRKGACDFIVKPIDFDVLVLSVDRALEKRRLLLENRKYQLCLEQKVREQAEKIHKAFLSAVKSLVYALEAKDVYTSGHSERVTKMAVEIAEAMGLSGLEVERIRLAGILHDVGKIGVPESILNKPGRLEKHEYEIVKTHSELGEKILRSVITDNEILQAIRHHHERYDGSGYPDRLSGTNIPKAARILAVADAYDAMTSDRPYRRAMSCLQACAELENGIGSQFDPEITTVFLSKVVSKFQPTQ
jgi:putative nucleotidyltransferase with HDIG domain